MFGLEAEEAGDLVVVVHTLEEGEALLAKAGLDAIGCAAMIEEVSAGRARGWLVKVPRVLRVPAAILSALGHDDEAFARLGSEPLEQRVRLFTEALTWNAVSEGRFGETLRDPRVQRWAKGSLMLDEDALARAYQDAEQGFRSRNTRTTAFASVLGVACLIAGIATGIGGWGFESFRTIGLLVLGAGSVLIATLMVVKRG